MGNSDSDKRNSFTDWTTSVYTYRLYSYDTSGHSHMWEINNESYSVFIIMSGIIAICIHPTQLVLFLCGFVLIMDS